MSSQTTPRVVISPSHTEDPDQPLMATLRADDLPQDTDEFNQDLAQASGKNPSVLLELDMNCNVIHLSKSWESVVGTSIQKIRNRPVSNIVLGTEEDKNVFFDAVSIMMSDDTSYRIRFLAATNYMKPDVEDESNGSELQTISEFSPSKQRRKISDSNESDASSVSSLSTNGEFIELEGQGILINNSSNVPTHSMWILKPFFPNSLNVELPDQLAQTLGFGAEIFTDYLSSLSEAGVINEDDAPAPPQVLCRICEQHVPSWWLEKHSELCLNEHKCESDVQMHHDDLMDVKLLLSKITESLQSADLDVKVEYKGHVLPRSSPIAPVLQSNSQIPSSTPLRRGRSGSILGTLRFPFKTLALLTDLCERGIEINPSEFNVDSNSFEFSPNTKNALSQAASFEIPASSDAGINMLINDVRALVKEKIDAISRMSSSLIYSQKIKEEVDEMVLHTIGETLKSIRNQTYDVQVPSRTPQMGSISQFLDSHSSSANSQGVSSATNTSNSVSNDSPKESPGPKILQPRPNALPNSIFSDAYMGTDSIPSPSLQPTDIIDSRGRFSPSRSITPSELARESQITTLHPVPRHPSPQFPVDGLPSLHELSIKSPLLTPQRRGSPIINPNGHNSPMSSIQRNSKVPGTIFGDLSSTPVGSPLISTTEGNDYLDAKRHSSNDNNAFLYTSGSVSSVIRPPPSPLLTATLPTKVTSNPSIKDYEIIKPISKGAFGSVYLARRKITGDYYAIKVLRKADMIAKNQVTNVKAERAVMMAQSDSPYVAKLFSSFQSKDSLFLVMEYLPGGDCSTLVKMLGNLPDQWAKQYIAEVVVGVEDMHKKGIVHHDLKPDNLLIASDGHLKLTDFGLSRMGLIRRQERANKKPGSISDAAIGQFGESSKIQRRDSIGHLQLSVNPSTSLSGASGSSGITGGSVISPSEFASSVSSPVSNFFDSYIKSEKKVTRSGSQGSTNFESPLLKPLHRSASHSSFILPEEEHIPLVTLAGNSPGSSISGAAVPTGSHGLPNLALYDPEESSTNKKFVGTPDYLSPETIKGTGESEVSDWWSVGCILFEFLFGYPPFHASSPEIVFKKILDGQIDWPDLSPEEELSYCTPEAKSLIRGLLEMDPDQRLGSNGAEEIKSHPYFKDIDWESLWDVDGTFKPVVEDPENTDYFEDRGASLLDFPVEDNVDTSHENSRSNSNTGTVPYSHPKISVEDEVKRSVSSSSPTTTSPGSTSNSPTQKHLSLAIPLHLRERRASKLNDKASEFGSFQFRNLSALDKANKVVINRIKAEHLEHRNSTSSSSSDSGMTRSRNYSISSASQLKRSLSPSASIMRSQSPVSFSYNSAAATPTSGYFNEDFISQQFYNERSGRSSPGTDSGSPSIKTFPHSVKPSTPTQSVSQTHSQSSSASLSVQSPQAILPHVTKVSRASLFQKAMSDFSASSSDTEDSKSSALERVRKRRQSSKMSDTNSHERSRAGSRLAILDVIICEPIPIYRYSLFKNLEELGCAVVGVSNADELIRRVTGEVKFDLILTALKIGKLDALDIVKLLKHTSNTNSTTPVIAVTAYYTEAVSSGLFNDVLEKPIEQRQLKLILEKHCRWKIQQSEEAVSDSESSDVFNDTR
ncbi:hypothetical protein WICPIJ_008104 [Wickerhamomyces pijperi]|uniref:non-specific serine/threonine protein kinase n=1 Tax=Wickerhamomyces pijperi TaxID=599730 RepID=A0A9P8TJ73_WICPI|nr:hypothetical protein WICPIJ_008104 [Wickerhamomyces pijperi]